MKSKTELVVALFGIAYLAAAGLFCLYTIYVFYAGGTLPLIGEIRGGFIRGTVWMLFGSSYFMAMLMVPMYGLAVFLPDHTK